MILAVIFIYHLIFSTQLPLLILFLAMNGLLFADVPLRNYSLTHTRLGIEEQHSLCCRDLSSYFYLSFDFCYIVAFTHIIMSYHIISQTLKGRTVSKLEQTSLSCKSRCSQYQTMMSGKEFLKSYVLSWRRKVYSDWRDATSSKGR